VIYMQAVMAINVNNRADHAAYVDCAIDVDAVIADLAPVYKRGD